MFQLGLSDWLYVFKLAKPCLSLGFLLKMGKVSQTESFSILTASAITE